MRTIKYRGKASHNGEWLYGDLINIHGEYHMLGEDDVLEEEVDDKYYLKNDRIEGLLTSTIEEMRKKNGYKFKAKKKTI